MAGSYVAGGNILPSVFVSQSVTLNRTVTASQSADQTVIGISGMSTHLPPLLGLDDTFHAIAGMNCQVFGPGDELAYLTVGSAAVTVGDFLKPDAGNLGKAITASADGDFYGAKALDSGAVGQIIAVKPMLGFRGV